MSSGFAAPQVPLICLIRLLDPTLFATCSCNVEERDDESPWGSSSRHNTQRISNKAHQHISTSAQPTTRNQQQPLATNNATRGVAWAQHCSVTYVEAVTRLEPNHTKEIVSESQEEALNIATSTHLSMLSTEVLQTFLQHCDELNERESTDLRTLVGDQSMIRKSNLDGILLDHLEYFVGTSTTEKRKQLVNVTIPKFDSAMTRHWLRTKKSKHQTLDLPHHAQEYIDGSDGRS